MQRRLTSYKPSERYVSIHHACSTSERVTLRVSSNAVVEGGGGMPPFKFPRNGIIKPSLFSCRQPPRPAVAAVIKQEQDQREGMLLQATHKCTW